MGRTRRIQVSMEPEEYERLETIAAERGVAVAELIRSAIRERYLLSREERRRHVEEILGFELPVIEWDEAEEEALESHDDGLR